MKLIIGLGNPGEKYSKVRHNLGFMTLDELVKKLDVGSGRVDNEVGSWKLEEKFKSEILEVNYTLLLVKPQTFMNNSGLAVKFLTTYYKDLLRSSSEDSITLTRRTLPFSVEKGKQPFTNLIVVHDDLDLMLGKIKVRLGGAGGGHHGVESIIKELGTDQFVRVRLGIGNLRSHSGEHKRIHFNAEHFVLESFMPNEKAKVKHMIKQAVEALELLLNKGLEVAQNQYN